MYVYHGFHHKHVFDIEYFHGEKSYKIFSTFILTILFDLSESSQMLWFKDLFG